MLYIYIYIYIYIYNIYIKYIHICTYIHKIYSIKDKLRESNIEFVAWYARYLTAYDENPAIVYERLIFPSNYHKYYKNFLFYFI